MADDLDQFVAPRYRSAGRRPEARNDRRASADAPLAALRGALAGVAGAPGDIESFIRMLPGLSEETVLPTSDDIEKRLPFREASNTPVGRAFTEVGKVGGGFYTGPGSPLRALAKLPQSVRKAGRDFAVASGQPAVNVVKNKGGNWINGVGGVERELAQLKRDSTADIFDRLPANIQKEVDAEAGIEELIKRYPKEWSAAQDPIDQWIDKQLTRYIKNEMATPEDPIRALAEQGITHATIEDVTAPSLWKAREERGFPREGMGQSDLAKAWESASDRPISTASAGAYARPLSETERKMGLSALTDDNPWLLKVPPNTPVHAIEGRDFAENLGFRHLIDELRNATNPDSGLPRELLLKYSSLPQVSVPQAVQRVHDINAWRAAQKAEADLARANNAATVLYKDYPDKGFRWVELKMPEKTGKTVQISKPAANLDEEMDMIEEIGRPDFLGGAGDEAVYNARVQSEIAGRSGDEAEKLLRDALKYEGETMGHCVGGGDYCHKILAGEGRIFSLRDAKGQPHVTIETRPFQEDIRQLPDHVLDAFDEASAPGPNQFQGSPEDFVNLHYPELAARLNDKIESIVQIKGKANRAPNEEYLPMVQDFVRSGKWSKVHDLENAGLRFNPETKTYDLIDPKQGFAQGGVVGGQETGYNSARIDALAQQLDAELFQ